MVTNIVWSRKPNYRAHFFTNLDAPHSALEWGCIRTILFFSYTPYVSYHFGNPGTQGGDICILKPKWTSCHSPGPPYTSLRCPLKPPDFRNVSKASSVAPIWKPLGQGRILAPSRSIFDPLGAPLAPLSHLNVPP